MPGCILKINSVLGKKKKKLFQIDPDNSITWNRSALNARCRICRRKGDPEKMLLCDGCDKGHHMYCLKPLLTVVPEGDW